MEPRIAWDTFIDPAFRFEIEHPMDWQVEADAENARLKVSEPERSVLWRTSVEVRSEKKKRETDADLLSDRVRELKALNNGYEFVNGNRLLHPCGAMAVHHCYRETRENAALLTREMLLNVPGEIRVYLLIGRSLADRADDWQPVFEHIFNSFQFTQASGKWVIPDDMRR